MSNECLKDTGFEALTIRKGSTPGFEQEHSDPICATSSLVFESAEQAAAIFSGERDRTWALSNAVRLMLLTANSAEVRTIVCQPASTTHGRLTDERKQLCGIA